MMGDFLPLECGECIKKAHQSKYEHLLVCVLNDMLEDT